MREGGRYGHKAPLAPQIVSKICSEPSLFVACGAFLADILDLNLFKSIKANVTEPLKSGERLFCEQLFYN